MFDEVKAEADAEVTTILSDDEATAGWAHQPPRRHVRTDQGS